MKKTWSVALVATALMFGSVACSSDDDSSKDDTTATTATPVTATASGDEGGKKKETVTDVRDPQGSVPDYAGAMQDASVDSCETADGALQVNGTVTNPLEEPQAYRIYVSAMEGDDTRGIVQVDLPLVGPEQTVDWDTELALSDQGLSCLLRVERFAPQG